MREGWRWFGPKDPVGLDAVRQAGASDIVSALHGRLPGEAWSPAEVEAHKALIENTPPGRTKLRWSVVESIPVPDAIKHRGVAARAAVDSWIASLEAVAGAGIRIVCYNVMPVVDWTRTDLDWPLPNGATALRFDHTRFAAFDLCILRRPGAESDYSDVERDEARRAFERMSEQEIAALSRTIAAGLPGAATDSLDLEGFRDSLAAYRGVDSARLRANIVSFLEKVTPIAEERGVFLTLHPDDPPRPLFGLPRIASTARDYAALFEAAPSPANGMCFCTGSLGVRPDNRLAAMARRFASRIHFAHLRSTLREADGKSFHEAEHLRGDVDMVAVMRVLLRESASRPSDRAIVFRPDHGHRMLDDLHRPVNPGYSAIGRLKGLAELRGLAHALSQPAGKFARH
ncbi:MAG: mannonate dehydratase [Salinarimonadaceae bacterium]|nr:MAG: mannonate dehydratase [Salinarimonadaceae bacterium]